MTERSAARYQVFLNNINKIAEDWGWNEEHQGGLWTTRSWVTNWQTIVTFELWDSCVPARWKIADEILDPNKTHKPDIYDRLFPSVERLANTNFCPRLGRSRMNTLKWIRPIVRIDIKNTAAEKLETPARHAQDQDAKVLQVAVLESLRVARSPLGHGQTSYSMDNSYAYWFRTISVRVQELSKAPEVNPSQVLTVLEGVYSVVRQTWDSTFGEGVSEFLLVESYLPNSATFNALCRQNLHEPALQPAPEAQVEGRQDNRGGFRNQSSRTLAPLMIPPSHSLYNAPFSATSSTFFSSPPSSPALLNHSYRSDLASSPPPMLPPPRPRRTSPNHRRRASRTTSISSVTESPLRQSFSSNRFSSGVLHSPASQRRPSLVASSSTTNHAFIPISRQDSPEEMIKVIAGNYAKHDASWVNEVRNRLHRLLSEVSKDSDRSATSNYGRVVEYLRGIESLKTLTEMDLPVELPDTVRMLLAKSSSTY